MDMPTACVFVLELIVAQRAPFPIGSKTPPSMAVDVANI
jgi:hypothetical protein